MPNTRVSPADLASACALFRALPFSAAPAQRSLMLHLPATSTQIPEELRTRLIRLLMKLHSGAIEESNPPLLFCRFLLMHLPGDTPSNSVLARPPDLPLGLNLPQAHILSVRRRFTARYCSWCEEHANLHRLVAIPPSFGRLSLSPRLSCSCGL